MSIIVSCNDNNAFDPRQKSTLRAINHEHNHTILSLGATPRSHRPYANPANPKYPMSSMPMLIIVPLSPDRAARSPPDLPQDS